jgi:uncharacterized integral membrane protein
VVQVQLYLFFGLLFAFVVAIFTVQNVAPVDVDFLFWQLREVSLSLVVMGSVFAGALIALVLGLARQYRMARRIRELAARLAEYELRPQPDAVVQPESDGKQVVVASGENPEIGNEGRETPSERDRL